MDKKNFETFAAVAQVNNLVSAQSNLSQNLLMNQNSVGNSSGSIRSIDVTQTTPQAQHIPSNPLQLSLSQLDSNTKSDFTR